MDTFQNAVDIANRAIQQLGGQRIDPALGFTEQSKNASEAAFAYNKLRQAELRRNLWTFATKTTVLRPIDINTMLLTPTLWSSVTTFFERSITADENGTLWESNIRNNLGNDPENSYTWNEYSGPLTVMKYDSSTSYFSDELVYTAPGDGSYNVYRSLQNSNVIDPSLPNMWSALTTYFQNQVVIVYPAYSAVTTYTQGQTVLDGGGNIYTSITNANLNHTPSSSPTFWAQVPTLVLTTPPVPSTGQTVPPQSSPVTGWSVATTYSLGSIVMFNAVEYVSILNNNAGNYPNAVASTFWKPLTGGVSYMSLIDFNTNNAPASTPAAWTTTFTQGQGNATWLLIGGAAFPMGVGLIPFTIPYPIGTGPTSQSNIRNVYRLPANYLRRAPRDPKQGSTSYLGSPTNLQYTDWVFSGKYFISRQADPIVFRFIADTIDVRNFDPMFCEALASRIATELCETITQSTDKKKVLYDIAQRYRSATALIDSIEQGATEPDLDDYLATRL